MRFDTDSPECAWEPFMEWMRSHGLDPRDAKSLDVDESAMTVTVHEYETPRRVVVDKLAMKDPRTVPIASLPPRRFSA